MNALELLGVLLLVWTSGCGLYLNIEIFAMGLKALKENKSEPITAELVPIARDEHSYHHTP